MDMLFMIIAICAVLIAIGSIVLVSQTSNSFSSNGKMILVGSIAAAVIFGFLSSTTIIPPRTVGITVAFGKPTQVLSNGLHFKAPWASVEKLDGAVQNDVYTDGRAVSVRLGNNSKATADASIQWQLDTKKTMPVFLNYRTFENIQQNLVDRNFRAAMNEVMAEYNPLDSIEAAQGGSDLGELSDKVLAKMNERVGDQIKVRSVTIPIINFDDSTQKRIDELQQETARTRIAEQKKETSKAEAEANELLEKSLNEETLISKCLDIVAKSGQSPIGCFPGNGGTVPIKNVDK